MGEYEGIFINEDKRYMTDAEWIQHLEHGIRELKKKIHNLKQEKAELKKDNKELREENKKLKEDNRFLTKISKEYMKKENIIEVAEFTELYKDDLEKENEELKKQIAEYDDLTEELDYRKREAKRLGWKPNLMEEDTLKELKDIGEF